MRKRADYVPAAPIARALRDWLREHDYGVAMGNGQSGGRYFSPLAILSERSGLAEDTIFRHSTGDRGYESMQFDVADRLLCAVGRFNWWRDDPDLAEVYEKACRGADARRPIAAAA